MDAYHVPVELPNTLSLKKRKKKQTTKSSSTTMSAKQLSDDCDHPSLKDIGRLLLESQELMFSKLSNVLLESQEKLVESQAKLLESQLAKVVESQASVLESQLAKLVEFQENTQRQVSEIFRSISGADNNNSKEEEKEEEIVDKNQASEQVVNNDWEKAKEVLEENPEAINRGLTEISSTILHLAIGYNAGMTFVEEIVKRMTPAVIAYRSTEMGDTALHSAVLYYGRTESAKLMVNKNPGLTQIRNKEGMVPLELALHHVTIGQKDIVEYLYSVTKDEYPSPFVGNVGARLLCSAIDANFYDIALSLVDRFPDLIMEKSLAHDMCAFEVLARRPFTFRSGAKLTWWQNCMYSTEFIYLADYRLPEQNIIEMAIAERNELMVNLICKSTIKKIDLVSRIDNDGNTILHYAAKLAPPAQLNLVPGVAIQMQRELQWFKVQEKQKRGNSSICIQRRTQKLVKEGEDWMKDTSGSCMIVTALIATVAFAAAFTVPGGNISDSNNPKNGSPVFLGKDTFTVFVVADTVALTSSVTSVLATKLIIGLATLFISMAAILVAFCASLFIVVGDKFPLLPIALFVCAPAALFAWLQLPLFYEMVRSTYWGSVLVNHIYIDPRLEKKNNERKNSKISRVKKLITSFWQ
ncbi:hypothetical protein MKW92_030705 [Papaver armeniacum]|nr:hypothetical protein MKW92_030705 [Papaver armeniacum]